MQKLAETKSVVAERFHALDATRAFALLLGVVFHAAWCFVPRGANTPMTDVSGNLFFDWFFFASHIFRMQVFFLIAGFFCRMVYHRRGMKPFVINRLTRIAVPLVVGWFILVPLIILTWIWGGNISGRNLTEVPLPLIIILMGMGLILVPRSMGGMFMLGHLWFLYYLLWFYVLVLPARRIVLRLTGDAERLRHRADHFVAWCICSPAAIGLLTVAMAIPLWGMDGWFGVDTPVLSLVPSLAVLTVYGGFFVFGYLIHRQRELLSRFSGRWKRPAVVALLLSIGCFAAFYRLEVTGVTAGAVYPELSPHQVADWPAFLERLRSPSTDDRVPQELAYLWDKFPATSQESLLRMPERPYIDLQQGVCQELTKMIGRSELFEPPERDDAGKPLPMSPRLLMPGEFKKAAPVNRQQLEALFQGSLRTDPRQIAWYWPVKFAYSGLYALAMWLSVFATLGFFQTHCTEHSIAWRYIADSSYWVYLAHIPLVPWLHIWIAYWPGPGIVKFLLLNLVSFVILYASYHYLVRSTFIGRVLNGRRYPLVPFPWSAPKLPPSA